jgi:hypothetical protein
LQIADGRLQIEERLPDQSAIFNLRSAIPLSPSRGQQPAQESGCSRENVAQDFPAADEDISRNYGVHSENLWLQLLNIVRSLAT